MVLAGYPLRNKNVPTRTLTTEYTFIRYVTWALSRKKVRQDPPAAKGISGTQGGERPRNHSEISGSYGQGDDRLRR